MNRSITLLTFIFCIFLSNSVFASETGWYLGLGIGQSSVDTGVSSTTGSASLDEEDTAYKVFVGYQINPYLAVEGFYLDAGSAELKGNAGDTFVLDGDTYIFVADDVKISTDAKTYGIAGSAGYPVHQYFYPYVKFGLHRWDFDASVSAGADNVSDGDDGTDLMYGLGIKADLTDNFSFRAEYEIYDFDGEDLDLMSAGIILSF